MKNIDKVKNILKDRKLSTVGKHRFFSVLIPLIEINGELNILYEVRSSNIRRQPGEVCFPGGAVEKDENPEETALRETFEEIGVESDKIEVISQGDSLISQNNFTVFSFFGILSEDVLGKLKLNRDEVAEVFTVPVRWFMNHEPELHTVDVRQFSRDDFPYEKANITPDYKWMRSSSEIPIYNYDNKAIWGMTGRMTRNFIQILKGEKE